MIESSLVSSFLVKKRENKDQHMIGKLKLIKNHYTIDYFIKDLSLFFFTFIIDYMVTSEILHVLEHYTYYLQLASLNFHTLLELLTLIIFIIIPFLVLYLSIVENLEYSLSKESKRNYN